MKLEQNQIIVIGIIAVALIFIIPKLGIFSVSNISLDANCFGVSNLNCNIIQPSVQVSNGYTIKIISPEFSTFNEILKNSINDSGVNNLIDSNSIIDNNVNSLVLSTQDKYNKYSTSFEGCSPNSCNGVVTSQDNGCNVYTYTFDDPVVHLDTGYRAWEDWNNGRLKTLCEGRGGTASLGIINYGPPYSYCGDCYQCKGMKTYCGGYSYKTSVPILYSPSQGVTSWGVSTIQGAQYNVVLSSFLSNLNGYECSWKGSAKGLYDSSIVKTFDIKGYTRIDSYEMSCIFDKVPDSFWNNDDVYVNDKTFTIDFSKKYLVPVKQDFYRFENNQCTLVNEYYYDKQINDSTQTECENKIVKSTGIISIPSNETTMENITLKNYTTNITVINNLNNVSSINPQSNNFNYNTGVIILIILVAVVVFILIKK